MNPKFYILFALSLFSLKINCQNASKQKEIKYPVPTSKNLLFYIQRSTNINTLVYEANFEQKDSINQILPVHIYWIKYAEHDQLKPLSTLERKYAYGVSVEVMNAKKKWFKIHLQAYRKIDVYIMNSKPGSAYHAYLAINGKLSRLVRIFFNIDGGPFWHPNVTYIELMGQDLKTGQAVKEKFKP